jgi:hypothetical protein
MLAFTFAGPVRLGVDENGKANCICHSDNRRFGDRRGFCCANRICTGEEEAGAAICTREEAGAAISGLHDPMW